MCGQCALMRKQARRDGRTLRAERSRKAVVEAALGLIQDGNLRPTAAEVAERAGVSLRLVFHHFKDMESVYRQAMTLQGARLAPMVPVLVEEGDSFESRLQLFVRRRGALYEQLTPVRKATRLLTDAPLVQEAVGKFRELKRQQLRFVFAEEVNALAGDEVRFDVAATSASWAFWNSLREHQGKTIEEAAAVVAYALRQALLG